MQTSRYVLGRMHLPIFFWFERVGLVGLRRNAGKHCGDRRGGGGERSRRCGAASAASATVGNGARLPVTSISRRQRNFRFRIIASKLNKEKTEEGKVIEPEKI